MIFFSLFGRDIQEIQTKDRIGLIKPQGSLYIFFARSIIFVNTCNSNSCNISFKNLWHSGLGHPSSTRLHILQSKYSYITYDHVDVCDACHHAKQRKLPYSFSTSNSKQPFELLHIDI